MQNDAFQAELERFDPELPIERAVTPPSSWYTTEAAWARERETVFRAGWLFACRAAQVAEPGAFVAGEVAGEPWIVLRGDDGELRAFFNVCRHHASVLLEGEGRCGEVVCPYHAWTYDLRGALRSAPRLGAVKDFRREDFGLRPIRLAEWGPFVFLDLGGEAPPLDEELAELRRRLDASDFTSLRFLKRSSYTLECNWKVYIDNYLDGGYHIPHAHRGLASELEMGDYRTELFGRYSIQSCPNQSDEAAVSERTAGADALYAWLYPNFAINRYGHMMDTNLVLPLGPERCEVVFDFFADDTVTEEAFLEKTWPLTHRIQDEDIAICERVQRGVRSSAYDVGRYAPSVETGELHFHRLLAEDMRRG